LSETVTEERVVAVEDPSADALSYLAPQPESAAVLLRYFNWKKDKLVETYMEDAEGTLAKAGIHEGGAQPRLKRVRGFVCEVCYDDATKETLAMSCDHRCESLWLELRTRGLPRAVVRSSS